MAVSTKRTKGNMLGTEILFEIERREVIAQVTDSPNGEPPLAVGFSIVCETIANTIRGNEYQRYSFIYGDHEYVFEAKPIDEDTE